MTHEFLWGFTAGVLFGAGVGGHCLRLLDTACGSARQYVAAIAVLVYALATALTACHSSWGLVLAMGGPPVGLTLVLATHNTVDRFQVVLGVFQLAAAVSAGFLYF